MYAQKVDGTFLPAYKQSLTGFGHKARETLDIFFKQDGELVGSSTLACIQLQTVIPKGTRLATREDLAHIKMHEPEFLQDEYFDVGVALHSALGPNEYLATILAEQLKLHRISLGGGKFIPFDALSLVEDEKAEHGLVLNLRPENLAGIIDLESHNWDYAGSRGLARAYLGLDSDWSSNGEYLAESGGGGRVVSVSAKGVARDIEARLA